MKIFILAVTVLLHAFSAQADYFSAPLNVAELKNVSLFTENGIKRRLFEILDPNKPLALIPGYFSCNSTCPVISENLARIIAESGLNNNLQVIFLSFNTNDKPEDIKIFRAHHNIPENWFLTVLKDETEGKEFLNPLGFQFRKVKEGFDHPNAIYVFSPKGKIWSGVLAGSNFSADDLKKSMREAFFNDRTDGWSVFLRNAIQPINLIIFGLTVIGLTILFVLGFLLFKRKNRNYRAV